MFRPGIEGRRGGGISAEEPKSCLAPLPPPLSFLITLQVPSRDITASGRVRGVPWVHREAGFFAGVEHPFSLNGRLEEDLSVAVCGVTGLPPLPVGEVSFDYTTVIGTFSYVGMVGVLRHPDPLLAFPFPSPASRARCGTPSTSI